MSKQKVLEIVKLFENGQFSVGFDLVNSLTLSSEAYYFNILIALSRCCHHSPEKCEAEYLEKICNFVSKSITKLDDKELNIYYQSVYHIIHFICNKKRIDILARLESVIIPRFLDKNSLYDDPARSTYNSLINLISRTVIRIVYAENATFDCVDDLMELIKIVVKAQFKLNNLESILNEVWKCYHYYRALDVSSPQMFDYFETVLGLIRINFPNNENSHEIQAMIFEIYSYIFRDSLQTELLRNTFDCTLRVLVNSLGKHDFSQEYLDRFSMFEIVFFLYPNELQKLDKNIETINQLFNMIKKWNENTFFTLLHYLNRALHELFIYYKNVGSELWINLPQDVILNMFKLFQHLTSHVHQSDMKCANIKDPEEKSDSCKCLMCLVHKVAFRIGGHVTDLLKSYVRKNCNTLDNNFFDAVIVWLNYYFDWLKKLKAAEWQYWPEFYKDLSAYAYNIGIVLFNGESPGQTLINRCLLKHIIEIEGTKAKVRTQDNVSFLFSSIAEGLFKTKKCIEGLGVAALHCLLYPNESETVIRRDWMKKKRNLTLLQPKTDDSLKQLTMVDVLQRQYNDLKDILNYEALLTNDKKIELLTLEITRYKQYWKNRASMRSCFDQLIEIADIPTFSDILIEVYGEGDILMLHEMLPILLKTKSKFEDYLNSNTDSKVQLAFAVLNYYIFEVSSIKKVDKNLKEMEMTMRVVESAKEKKYIDVVPKDANDECDIVSAYSNLRLSKFLCVLKFLDTARKLLSSVIEDIFEINVFKAISNLLYAMSLKYRLHNFTIANLQCCFMSMKCAEKAGNSELILLNLSRMVECGDIRKEYIKNLIDTGDKLEKELQSNNSDGKYNKTLAIYNISKSKLLLHNDPKEAFKLWQIANSICSLPNSSSELEILKADIHVVLFKLTKSCNFIPGEHEREPMTLKLHWAYDVVLGHIKKCSPDPFVLSISLDTIYELIQTYKTMRLPRDLRAYSKEIVFLTQKLVIPLRLVQLLICLGYSDVTTGLFDHCRVKLNGIDDILTLNHTSTLEVAPKVESVEKVVEKEVDKCTDMIEELVLDVPDHYRQYHPSSPILTVETFKLPSFVSHNKLCLCLMCRSTELQRLILQKYYLSALTNMYEKDNQLAENFVAGALDLYEYLKFNYGNYRSKVGQLMPEALIPNFDDMFLEVYANILYEYSYHMSRKNLKDEAKKINEMLLKTLQPQKIRYVHLYNDLLMQKLDYLMSKKMVKNSLTAERNYLTYSSPNMPKTPIRYTSVPMKICLSDVPTYSPPRRKPRRCKLFDSNDIDVNSPAETLKNIRQKKPKKPLIEEETLHKPKEKTTNIQPTFSIAVDAPKITIFSDVEPKTRSTNRKNSKTSKTASTENEVITNTSSKSKLTKKQTESQGDGDKLSTSQKMPVTTKTRGQLLTKKIKESSRLKEALCKNKLLPDKCVIEEQKSNDTSSLIPESPENRKAAAKSAEFMEKLTYSLKKSAQTKKANQENLPSNSESTSSTSTGAIRKSARVCKRIF